MFRDRPFGSALQTLSWHIVGSVTTTALVFIFTRRLVLSLTVGAVEFGSKVGLFWLHQRFWDRLAWGKQRIRPAVIWLTGLSASGKSTVADWVAQQLVRRGLPVERLDGDAVRQIFPATGYSHDERDAHLRRVGYLASKLEAHGVFVVASFVSPYAESRQFIRNVCGSFLEVYVSTPLEECERRDPKGLYARARRGEIANFTGIGDPYEPPSAPEVSIDTSTLSVEAAGGQILKALSRRRSG